MKYCLVDSNNQKVSRFLSKKACELKNKALNNRHTIMSKIKAIELGIFEIPKRIKTVGTYIPIQMVKGTFFKSDVYSEAFANEHNTVNYKRFCEKNGTIYPI